MNGKSLGPRSGTHMGVYLRVDSFKYFSALIPWVECTCKCSSEAYNEPFRQVFPMRYAT